MGFGFVSITSIHIGLKRLSISKALMNFPKSGFKSMHPILLITCVVMNVPSCIVAGKQAKRWRFRMLKVLYRTFIVWCCTFQLIESWWRLFSPIKTPVKSYNNWRAIVRSDFTAAWLLDIIGCEVDARLILWKMPFWKLAKPACLYRQRTALSASWLSQNYLFA